MCFSATASFTSGAILAAAGAVTLKTAPKISQKFFGAIPLIFALQQITEGFLWLTLKGKIDPDWQQIITLTFIAIAQAFWPFWVPLSIALMEEKPVRKKILYGLTAIGGIIAITITYRLMYFPVYAAIEGHHIAYHFE